MTSDNKGETGFPSMPEPDPSMIGVLGRPSGAIYEEGPPPVAAPPAGLDREWNEEFDSSEASERVGEQADVEK